MQADEDSGHVNAGEAAARGSRVATGRCWLGALLIAARPVEPDSDLYKRPQYGGNKHAPRHNGTPAMMKGWKEGDGGNTGGKKGIKVEGIM